MTEQLRPREAGTKMRERKTMTDDKKSAESKRGGARGKKMPPLPEGSTQNMPEESPPQPSPQARAGLDLQATLAGQRAQARERAMAARKRVKGRSSEEIINAVAANTAEIHASTDEITSAGQQLQATLAEIGSSAQQASSATEQSTAGVRQLLTAAEASGRAAGVSLERVGVIERLIQAGVGGVRGLIGGVSLALETNSAASAAVAQVDRQSVEILRSVEQIGGVAEQISLLSFNAALEASRAGAMGAGFSVVSDEVRKLAEKAAQSSRNVSEVVRGIAAAVTQVNEDMAASIDDGQRWLDQGEGLAANLADSIGQIARIREGSTVISSAADALADKLGESQRASVTIEAATRQSAQAAVEAQGALREQQDALRGIQAAARDLAEQAEVLNKAEQLEQAGVEELGTVADELSATVQEASASGTQIGSAVREIAQASLELQGQAAASAPIINDAEEGIGVIDQRTRECQEAVEVVQALLSETRGGAATLIDNIETAATRNREYAENVRKLNGEILRIDEVIDAMLSVGIITNVLAVNGRIEGARAGDKGGGFTAVSEDIRSLAEETSNQVLGIRRLLRDIQLAGGLVAADLEKAGTAVRTEVDKSRPVVEQFARIDDDIAVILTGAEEIATAARQAVAAVPQVRQGTEQIATAARQAAAAAQEASGGADEQSRALAQLSNAVDDLAVQIPYLR